AYAYMAAHRSVDVVINISDMAVRGRDHRELQAEILATTGLDLDLQGCRESTEVTTQTLGAVDEAFCTSTLRQAADALGIGQRDPAFRFTAQMIEQLIRDTADV